MNKSFFDLTHFNPAWLNQTTMSPELICRYHALPLTIQDGTLTLGVTETLSDAEISALSFHIGCSIQPVLVDATLLNTLIARHYQPRLFYANLETTLLKMTAVEEPHLAPDYYADNSDEPVIRFVDHLLQDAIHKQASDIHLEPYEQQYRIRFRVDGLLQETASIPLHLAHRALTRLKILAQMNIAERRLPQDGRITMPQETHIDMRVNTCPTLHGEKMAIRILDAHKTPLDLNTLGLTPPQRNLFIAKLSQPQGLILVTGPTGSGKTLTLYSALHYLNAIDKNISTVEDPVEIKVPGINQVNVNTSIGLNFTTVLRTFLRQDPDIIMLGEIRDAETAAIAMQAAQTGHLVLSTLHTNNAAEAILRLQSMGIPPYTLANSLSLIIAQRLVRRLSPQGYLGRTGIFELLPMTSDVSQLVLSGATSSAISELALRKQWMLLHQAGRDKVKNGITNLAEIQRVLGL